MNNNASDYLCHYGRLGMRWGEHIYGNRGEYSREGAQRLRQKKQAYAEAKRNARIAKARYYRGIGKRSAYRQARSSYKQARRERNNAYDQLVKDARADRGKKLVERGVTKVNMNSKAARVRRAGELVGIVGARVIGKKYGAMAARSLRGEFRRNPAGFVNGMSSLSMRENGVVIRTMATNGKNFARAATRTAIGAALAIDVAARVHKRNQNRAIKEYRSRQKNG